MADRRKVKTVEGLLDRSYEEGFAAGQAEVNAEADRTAGEATVNAWADALDAASAHVVSGPHSNALVAAAQALRLFLQTEPESEPTPEPE